MNQRTWTRSTCGTPELREAFCKSSARPASPCIFALDAAPDFVDVKIAMEDDRPAGGEDRNEKGGEPSGVIDRCKNRADVRVAQLPAERRVVPFQAIIRCGIITPLGLPVVPLVYSRQ